MYKLGALTIEQLGNLSISDLGAVIIDGGIDSWIPINVGNQRIILNSWDILDENIRMFTLNTQEVNSFIELKIISTLELNERQKLYINNDNNTFIYDKIKLFINDGNLSGNILLIAPVQPGYKYYIQKLFLSVDEAFYDNGSIELILPPASDSIYLRQKLFLSVPSEFTEFSTLQMRVCNNSAINGFLSMRLCNEGIHSSAKMVIRGKGKNQGYLPLEPETGVPMYLHSNTSIGSLQLSCFSLNKLNGTCKIHVSGGLEEKLHMAIPFVYHEYNRPINGICHMMIKDFSTQNLSMYINNVHSKYNSLRMKIKGFSISNINSKCNLIMKDFTNQSLLMYIHNLHIKNNILKMYIKNIPIYSINSKCNLTIKDFTNQSLLMYIHNTSYKHNSLHMRIHNNFINGNILIRLHNPLCGNCNMSMAKILAKNEIKIPLFIHGY